MKGSNRLHLLVINWLDRENPQAGGAEVHLHEIFGRLAAKGHRITVLCSGFEGASPRAEMDGMSFHRVGGRHSFTLKAAPYYRRHLADEPFELVIEDINKIPLYSPLWAGAPVVALVPHLFGTTAFREAPAPMAAAVWLAERPVHWIYRRSPFQAISESTRNDLASRGVPRDRIAVIYPGIDHDRFKPDPTVRPFDDPTFVYVGRLKRYKGLEVVVDAVARVKKSGLNARLVVAGKGDHEKALRDYSQRTAPGAVDFLGFISEDDKVNLLRRAWATVYSSPKEGWGITNVEAAACGTPALASDSPGLKESVRHGTSGLVIPHGQVAAWEEAMIKIATDSELRQRLSQGALQFAASFSWDRAAEETETHLIESLVRESDTGANVLEE